MKDWWNQLKESIKLKWISIKAWLKENWKSIALIGLDKLYEFLKNSLTEKKASRALKRQAKKQLKLENRQLKNSAIQAQLVRDEYLYNDEDKNISITPGGDE